MTGPHVDGERLDLIAADIAREGAVLRDQTPALRESAEAIAEAISSGPSRAFLIGCGDSLDGSMAARYAWDGLVDFPVEAVPAMTFVTSILDAAPADALVVALSQSGRVSRVVESVRAARARGLSTVTITANPESPLAREPADAGFVIGFDKLGAIPGTTSHLLGAVALYELGCALSSNRGPRDGLRADLDGLGDLVDEAIAGCSETAERHARAMSRDLPILLLGYGPVLSSARFTVRKVLELTQLIAMWQETEEYAHDEYSLVGSDFRLTVFAPPDRGVTRSHEVARYLRRLGVHLSVVTDVGHAGSYENDADLIYRLPACPPSLVPLLYSIPGQLLSVASARTVGGSLYGMAEQVHRDDGDPQIYESAITT
jgi:glucosamine--fructose-6-phosphate aminotransferase (isomerizing)